MELITWLIMQIYQVFFIFKSYSLQCVKVHFVLFIVSLNPVQQWQQCVRGKKIQKYKKKTQQALCLFCRNETRCKWRGVQRASVVMPSSSGGFLCAAAYMFATIFTCPVDHRRDDCRKKAIFLTSDSTFKAQTCDFCITIDSWTSWAGDWMVRRKKETWRHVFLLCCSKKQQKKTKLSDNILNWHIFDVVHCAVFFLFFFK